MKKGWLGTILVSTVLTAALIGGGAIAVAAASNAATQGAFSTSLAFVLLKVDSDSDPETTLLAPMPSANILRPGFAGIFKPLQIHRHAAAPRYAFIQPRSPPCGLPRFSG